MSTLSFILPGLRPSTDLIMSWSFLRPHVTVSIIHRSVHPGISSNISETENGSHSTRLSSKLHSLYWTEMDTCPSDWWHDPYRTSLHLTVSFSITTELAHTMSLTPSSLAEDLYKNYLYGTLKDCLTYTPRCLSFNSFYCSKTGFVDLPSSEVN